MEANRSDRRGARFPASLFDRRHLVGMIGQTGEEGSHEHSGSHPRLRQLGDGLNPSHWGRRTGLGQAPHLGVEGAYREADRDIGAAGRLHEQVEVTRHESGFGQDGERVGKLGEHLEHSSSEPVLAFGRLIRVGVGAHRNRFARPPPGSGLGSGEFDGVDLHHDLGVEVLSYVESEVFVGGPGKAVAAGMAAAAVRIDRSIEGKPVAGHAVEDGLGFDLVEREPAILTAAADTPAQFEQTPLGGGSPPQFLHRGHGTERMFDQQGVIGRRATFARRSIGAVLLDKRELAGIEAGTITVVFRHWRAPRIRVGTRMRTPVGLVEITGLTRTSPEAVPENEANAAGFADLDEFHGWLDDRPGDLYRIGLQWAGADARVALRDDDDLGEAEIAEMRRRLARMDRRADSPWTRQTLRLIEANPGVVSTDLAASMGLERQYLKRRVRRLKEVGLTESLGIGYLISPRGQALQNAREDPAEGC